MVISSDDFLVARVPPGASSGPVVVSTNGAASNPHQIKVAALIAENLHPVTNPALDADGNIYVTFSGSRGQKVPVAIYQDRHQLQRQAVPGGDDQRHGHRV